MFPFLLRQLGHMVQLHSLSFVSAWCAEDSILIPTVALNREQKVGGRGMKPGLLWFLCENIAGSPTVRKLLCFPQKQISLSRAQQIASVITSSKARRKRSIWKTLRWLLLLSEISVDSVWWFLFFLYLLFCNCQQRYPFSKDLAIAGCCKYSSRDWIQP